VLILTIRVKIGRLMLNRNRTFNSKLSQIVWKVTAEFSIHLTKWTCGISMPNLNEISFVDSWKLLNLTIRWGGVVLQLKKTKKGLCLSSFAIKTFDICHLGMSRNKWYAISQIYRFVKVDQADFVSRRRYNFRIPNIWVTQIVQNTKWN